jgi:Ca2+-binding RTX toxin-like protein
MPPARSISSTRVFSIRNGSRARGTSKISSRGRAFRPGATPTTALQEVDFLNGTTYTGYTHVSGLTPDPVGSLGNSGTNTVVILDQLHAAGRVAEPDASGAGNSNVGGNSLANVITANDGNNILAGAGGNDTFVFGPSFGKVSITDFHVGDTIKFDHTVFATVQAVLAALGPPTPNATQPSRRMPA